MFENYKGKIPKKLLQELEKEAIEQKLTKAEIKKALEKLAEEYNYAKINPGEAIGMITAESFGEPGTQMSLLKSDKIIIKLNSKIKVVKIGEFVDSLMELKGSLKINEDSEILPLHDLEVYVPSLNQEEKTEWKKVIECSRHKSPDKLMKIKTKSGRGIICTDNHSFVIRSNNLIMPVDGRKLKVGDRIPVLNNFLTEIPLNEIKVNQEIIDERLVVEEDMLCIPGRNAKPINNSIQLDCSTGWYIGAYLAEGSANGSGISISNINEGYIACAKEFADSIGVDYVDKARQGEYGPSRSLIINSTLLGKLIGTTCGTGSTNKQVPDFAYSASDEFVSGLLKGYFDGDGNFHVDRKMIRVSSNSKKLLDGIALLLSRFKIFSFKTKDHKGQHWLLIPYKYAPLFLAHISSDFEEKYEALKILAEKSKRFWNDKSQDYTDMISGFDDLFYKTAKKLGYRTRYINNFTKRQKIGRTALYRYIKLFQKLAKEKNINIEEELKIMKRMFYSDVIWDEIAEVEYVDKEYDHVYDLSVPGLETFTTFDGIITHNTLNTFHFAGVAEVNVTLGLPRLIEILDARKELKTPAMEVYLHKEYNKDANKARKIAASIKQITFKELVNEFSLNISKNQIEVDVNKKRMRDLGITENRLATTLKEALKGATINQLRTCLVVKPKDEEDLRELYKLKEKIKEIVVKGVPKITQVMPVKSKNEFIIITAGSNLRKILELKEVDETKTKTNNIFEVAEVLGIEAARQAIINEAETVIKDQGLDVDTRHIMLVADLMTVSGACRGVTRSGITSGKESVLARASFETPIRHIMSAAKIGEEDKLNSVIENVLLNQPVPLGTGLPELVAKVKKK